jgi:hypothetical protein
MEVLEVPKEVKILLNLCRACTCILLGGGWIHVALAVHANRRHLPKWCVEGTRLTSSGIPGVIDTLRVLSSHRRDQRYQENVKAKSPMLRPDIHDVAPDFGV